MNARIRTIDGEPTLLMPDHHWYPIQSSEYLTDRGNFAPYTIIICGTTAWASGGVINLLRVLRRFDRVVSLPVTVATIMEGCFDPVRGRVDPSQEKDGMR